MCTKLSPIVNVCLGDVGSSSHWMGGDLSNKGYCSNACEWNSIQSDHMSSGRALWWPLHTGDVLIPSPGFHTRISQLGNLTHQNSNFPQKLQPPSEAGFPKQTVLKSKRAERHQYIILLSRSILEKDNDEKWLFSVLHCKCIYRIVHLMYVEVRFSAVLLLLFLWDGIV